MSAVSFSFFVGVASGILPAMQASKLNVVDALRS
jgi:ABC-type antimicrobial peptide transport system permease subunit